MKKYYIFFGEGSQINQLICAVLINMPMFAYGAAIGWMSPTTLLLQSEHSPRGKPMTDTEISWMASCTYLMCSPCNFLCAFLGDRIGRKKTLLILSAALAVSWIINLSSYEPWAFILARVILGITMGGVYVICPSYTKEISQDNIRGLLGSLPSYQVHCPLCCVVPELFPIIWMAYFQIVLFQTSGNLLLYILGDILNYNTVLWVCLAMPVLHLILFMMMPESPSYLVKTGEFEEAARVLAWLRCSDEDAIQIKTELEDIRREQKNDEEGNRFVWKSIVRDKIVFRAFRIAMVVALAREVCGAIPVLNFAGDIFSMASTGSGLTLTPNQQAMVLGAVQVAGSTVASGLVEKAGRKVLLFVTSLVSGLSMCALASWFLVKSCGMYAPAWIPVATLCLCIFCDSAGLQPISVVVIGEIFSFKYRGTVMAATMAAASSSDFLQMLFFKPLATAIGVHVAFFFFGFVCLLAALYVLLVVPETRNRTLDEIYKALKTKKEKEKEIKEIEA